MRLLFVCAAIVTLSLAENEQKHYENLESAESIELHKNHDLKPSATLYNSVPYPSWNNPQKYIPSTDRWTQTYPQSSNYNPYPNYPHYLYPTTTPVPVIKNEQYFGNDGSYRYEYQLGDGTWVGEQGYFAEPSKTDKSFVKKGWYSFVGGDGKTYTVTYWADHTGYHAYGDHLPTPPPIPPAIQAGIDQSAKEEAAKAEAEKNKPYYPITQIPIYYDPPQQPQHPQYPAQQPQQPYYPPQQPQQYYPPPPTKYPAAVGK